MKISQRVRSISVVALLFALTFFGASSAQAALSPTTGSTAGGTSVTVNGIHFVKVSTGAAHMLGLTDQGTVYSWGVGSSGALGNGGTSDSSVPVEVVGVGGVGILSGVTDISAGYNHSLALTADGVVAWGRNLEGQLGNGSFSTNSLTPVLVLKGASPSSTAFLQDVVSVSAGQYFSSALTTAGTVYSWGQNSSGQLGDGNTTNLNIPVQTQGLTGVSAIECGYNHALALVGGNVYSWGANASGQLGNGTTTGSGAPVLVLKGQQTSAGPNLSGATKISAGGSHSIAITSSGLFSWGGNGGGQLGDSTTVAASSPIQVLKGASSSSSAFFEEATQIDAGSNQTFALNSTGLFSWGTNASGEAGNVVGGRVPTNVVAIGGVGNMTGVIQFSSGWAQSAVVTDAGIASMGRGSAGRLGNGANLDQAVPVLGPNFAVTSVTFGSQAASVSSVSGSHVSVITPAGSAGQVAVSGVSNVFGGTTAASPASAVWIAGTYTYTDIPASQSSPLPTNSGSALANSGSSNVIPGAIAGIMFLLVGAAGLAIRRHVQR